MQERDLAATCFKVCGAAALSAAGGYVGPIAAAAFAGAIGGSLAVPEFHSAVKELLKYPWDFFRESMVHFAAHEITSAGERRETGTALHLTRVMIGSLRRSVKAVHDEAIANGFTELEKSFLADAANRLKWIERDDVQVRQFGDEVGVAIAAQLRAAQQTGGIAGVASIVQAISDPQEAIKVLWAPIEQVLDQVLASNPLYAHTGNRVQLVAMVGDVFSRDLGERAAEVLVTDPEIRAKFDSVAAELQVKAQAEHQTEMAQIASEMAVYKQYIMLSHGSQRQTLTTVQRIQTQITALGKDTAAIRVLLEKEFEKTHRELHDIQRGVDGLHDEVLQNREISMTILRFLKSRFESKEPARP
jgi:hypothetical protein